MTGGFSGRRKLGRCCTQLAQFGPEVCRHCIVVVANAGQDVRGFAAARVGDDLLLLVGLLLLCHHSLGDGCLLGAGEGLPGGDGAGHDRHARAVPVKLVIIISALFHV